MIPLENFFPSDKWLQIRYYTPGYEDRGKPHRVRSEVERRRTENESEAGIKRHHRRGYAIAFASLMIMDAFEEFFSREGGDARINPA